MGAVGDGCVVGEEEGSAFRVVVLGSPAFIGGG